MQRIDKQKLLEYLKEHPWFHSTTEVAEFFDCSRAYAHKLLAELECEKNVVTLTIGKSIGWISAFPPENNKRYAQWMLLMTAVSLQNKNRHSLVENERFPLFLIERLNLINQHVTHTFNIKENVS